VAQGRTPDAHASCVRDHQPGLAALRRPIEVEGESTLLAKQPHLDPSGGEAERDRSFEPAENVFRSAAEPARERPERGPQREAFQIAAAVAKQRHAARQIDGEPEPRQNPAELGNFEGTQGDRTVKLDPSAPRDTVSLSVAGSCGPPVVGDSPGGSDGGLRGARALDITVPS